MYKRQADYRAAVLLADVEEFSYKEIAGLLGVPIGTVTVSYTHLTHRPQARCVFMVEFQV